MLKFMYAASLTSRRRGGRRLVVLAMKKGARAKLKCPLNFAISASRHAAIARTVIRLTCLGQCVTLHAARKCSSCALKWHSSIRKKSRHYLQLGRKTTMALQNAKSARKVKKGKAKSQALVALPWLDGCTVQKFAGCDVAPHYRQ